LLSLNNLINLALEAQQDHDTNPDMPAVRAHRLEIGTGGIRKATRRLAFTSLRQP
jgi:hypothetical protein